MSKQTDEILRNTAIRHLALTITVLLLFASTSHGAIITAHVRVVNSTPGQFIALEQGATWLGYDPARYSWHDYPAILDQQPRFHIWQVTGDSNPRESFGKISFEVLTDGVVLLAVTNRWGGGGNPGGDWIPELTTEQEFLDDGWTEFASPMRIYHHGLGEVLSDFYFTVYRRDSFAGETFTYRTEKYHPPHLLTTQFTAPVPEPATIAVWSLIGLCGVGYGVRRRMKKAA